MTTTRTMLRDSALGLPLFAAVSWWLAGGWFALGVVTSGLVALGNLALLSFLIGRLTASMAVGRSPGAAGVVLSFKFALILVAFVGLMYVFPPLSAAVGLGSAMTGLCLRPMVDVLRLPTPEELAQESN